MTRLKKWRPPPQGLDPLARTHPPTSTPNPLSQGPLSGSRHHPPFQSREALRVKTMRLDPHPPPESGGTLGRVRTSSSLDPRIPLYLQTWGPLFPRDDPHLTFCLCFLPQFTPRACRDEFKPGWGVLVVFAGRFAFPRGKRPGMGSDQAGRTPKCLPALNFSPSHSGHTAGSGAGQG